MKTYGLDAETYKGDIRCLATNEDVIEYPTFEDILKFFTRRKYRSSTLYSFNARFESEVLMKLIGNKDTLYDIYINGAHPKGVNLDAFGCNVRYIPSKLFRICKDKHCVTIFDIAQFYAGWSLEKAAQQYLGEGKNPCNAKRIGQEKGYYERHNKEVMRYCIKDAELALRLSNVMKNVFENTNMQKGKLSFTRPISQAKIAEKYILTNFKYPKILDAIQRDHYAAELSYNGGIFQTYKRGVFEQPLYLYDINSAYPAVLQGLPHWGNGYFYRIKTPEEYDTPYGWYLCSFDCKYIPHVDRGHPYEVEICYGIPSEQACITLMMNPKRIVYPTGKRTRWITKYEYLWMLNKGFKVTWVQGCEWVQDKNEYESPFAWIPEVYKRRQAIKDADKNDITQNPLKILMNSSYGKTAQKKKGLGRMSNFFYASYTTAVTRITIAEVLFKYPYTSVEAATDSVLLTHKIDLPLSKKLGEWGLDTYKRGVVVGSGIKQLWKNDKEFTTRARGVTDKSDWNMEETIRTGYNDREKKPNLECDYLYFAKERPIHIGEMLTHTKILNFEDLGDFKLVSKKLNCNTDKKGRWERDYKDWRDFVGAEVQSSLPLRIGMEVD